MRVLDLRKCFDLCFQKNESDLNHAVERLFFSYFIVFMFHFSLHITSCPSIDSCSICRFVFFFNSSMFCEVGQAQLNSLTVAFCLLDSPTLVVNCPPL